MDREREQFYPERYIVKKLIILMLRIKERSQLQKQFGIDQDKFFLQRKSGKKGSVILAGMGRVSCRNSYQV
jgi:hypothetical protein